jgi:hypothetical protein
VPKGKNNQSDLLQNKKQKKQESTEIKASRHLRAIFEVSSRTSHSDIYSFSAVKVIRCAQVSLFER